MTNTTVRRPSAYYWAPVHTFLSERSDRILGTLASAHTHALDIEQRRAWEEEIDILKSALASLSGTIYLEFEVPRLGSRIDAVFVSGSVIFPIEFKCGEDEYRLADYNQAWDYALDLKNFHAASHHAHVLPMLVATAAHHGDDAWQQPHSDGVRPPRRCQPVGMPRAFTDGLEHSDGLPLNGEAWGTASYQPTPTIIEAARACTHDTRSRRFLATTRARRTCT